DPHQPTGVGGPSADHALLRWKIAIVGTLAGVGRDTCFIVPVEFISPGNIEFDIPDWIAAGDITLRVRLCDCAQCDIHPRDDSCRSAGQGVSPGGGFCVDPDIPCVLAGPAPDGHP